MDKYIVTKHIELRWETEANSHEEARAIVGDMGESAGHYTEKTRVVKIGQDPYGQINYKTFIGLVGSNYEQYKKTIPNRTEEVAKELFKIIYLTNPKWEQEPSFIKDRLTRQAETIIACGFSCK